MKTILRFSKSDKSVLFSSDTHNRVQDRHTGLKPQHYDAVNGIVFKLHSKGKKETQSSTGELFYG